MLALLLWGVDDVIWNVECECHVLVIAGVGIGMEGVVVELGWLSVGICVVYWAAWVAKSTFAWYSGLMVSIGVLVVCGIVRGVGVYARWRIMRVEVCSFV